MCTCIASISSRSLPYPITSLSLNVLLNDYYGKGKQEKYIISIVIENVKLGTDQILRNYSTILTFSTVIPLPQSFLSSFLSFLRPTISPPIFPIFLVLFQKKTCSLSSLVIRHI